MTRWIAPLALLALAACQPGPVKVVVLTPTTPEVEQVLRAADARWEAAGVDPDRIQIGPGGAPVRLVPERCAGAVCVGETRVTYRAEDLAGVRWMELPSLDVGIATHELGHALGIQFHPDGDPQHDPAGVEACSPDAEGRPLMCSHVGPAIVAADMGEACAVGACDHFTPER